MPITSQIRLNQLTGSFGNASTKNTAGMIRTDSAPKILEAVGAIDLTGSLSAMASAIGRIHGAANNEAFDNAVGTFYTDILPDGDGTRDLGSTAKEFAEVHANKLESQVGLDIDAGQALSLDGASGINIGTAANVAVDFNASTFDLDATGALAIDSATSISIGTNADKPIDIDSTTLDIDASGAVTIDTSGGSAISLDADAASNFSTSAGDLSLIADAATAKVLIRGDHESDVAIHLDGNAAAGSVVDIDAGLLDVDASAAVEIQAATDSFFKSSGGDVTIEAEGDAKKVVVKGDHESGTAIHLDANQNAASVIDVDFGVFDADGTTFNVDTTGAIALNAAGVASNFTLTADGDGQDLTIAQDGSHDASVILNSAGTGNDAILINASAGGVKLAVPDGKPLSAGLAGGVELLLVPHGTPALEEGKLLNTSGTGNQALLIEASAGTVAISGSAGVSLSGSLVAFSTTGSHEMLGDRLRLADEGEFATFVGKPLFSNNTTLVGALNALATAAGGGTVGKAVITGSAAVSKLQLQGAGMSNAAGFTQVIDLREATPSNTEVYVNGQLMVSGTSAAGTGGDYGVDYTDPGAINFQFNLVQDDVVFVKTSAEQ